MTDSTTWTITEARQKLAAVPRTVYGSQARALAMVLLRTGLPLAGVLQWQAELLRPAWRAGQAGWRPIIPTAVNWPGNRGGERVVQVKLDQETADELSRWIFVLYAHLTQLGRVWPRVAHEQGQYYADGLLTSTGATRLLVDQLGVTPRALAQTFRCWAKEAGINSGELVWATGRSPVQDGVVEVAGNRLPRLIG